MKLLNFAVIKITFCLILGIILSHYFSISKGFTLLALLILLLSLSLFLIIEKKRLVKSDGFGAISFLTFVCLGVLTYQFHDQKEFKNHYFKHVLSHEEPISELRIREVLKPGINHDRYIVDILRINTQARRGKTLLNIRKDSMIPAFEVDDPLMATTAFRILEAPLNPDQFDYKAYLEKQYIYHQLFASPNQIFALPTSTNTLMGSAAKLRDKINTQLAYYNFKPDELAIINALLLGQRQDISPEIFNNYSKAGAVHILAVSGLHVGIVLLLLNILFRPLEYIKHGRTIKTIIIVLILWGFAIVAGLSASVTRAVTMFSIVAIGMNLKRATNIYNTLTISMLLLLLFKPLFLFDVGFQMSYLALLAIVSFQPVFVKLWQPKYKVIEKLWQIFTVTMAAQLGVMPISLFYFHQFPGLFFISNLLIIPFLGIILGTGILVILMALTNILPFWLADIYGMLIHTMNQAIKWVALQERFIFTEITFSKWQVFSSYLLIIALFFLFKKQNFNRLTTFLIAILIMQVGFLFEKHKNRTSEMIVFNKPGLSIIGFKERSALTLSINPLTFDPSSDPIIRNYRIGNGIKEINIMPIKDIYFFQKNKILIIDSLGIYTLPNFQTSHVVLRNSPKINLERLLSTLSPAIVIADASNYGSYLERWEATCRKENVPFHRTNRKGAYIIIAK